MWKVIIIVKMLAMPQAEIVDVGTWDYGLYLRSADCLSEVASIRRALIAEGWELYSLLENGVVINKRPVAMAIACEAAPSMKVKG